MNPYKVLGLIKKDNPASTDIARAYRQLALLHHPDRNPDGAELFKQISAAYAILSDPTKKQLYDQHGVVAGENGEAQEATEAERSAELGAEIAAFYATYAGSTEERDDLKASYQRCGGDFSRLIGEHALFDNGKPGEVQRIKHAIDSLIASGDLEITRRWSKSVSEDAIEKLQRRMDKERRLAEKELTKLHGEEGFTVAPKAASSLQELILRRRDDSFQAMMTSLEEKYGKRTSKRKEGKRTRED